MPENPMRARFLATLSATSAPPAARGGLLGGGSAEDAKELFRVAFDPLRSAMILATWTRALWKTVTCWDGLGGEPRKQEMELEGQVAVNLLHLRQARSVELRLLHSSSLWRCHFLRFCSL